MTVGADISITNQEKAMIPQLSLDDERTIQEWLTTCINHDFCDQLFNGLFGVAKKRMQEIRKCWPNKALLPEIHRMVHEALLNLLCLWNSSVEDDYVNQYECCYQLASATLAIKDILDKISGKNTLIIYDKTSLIQHIDQEQKVDYLFFWNQKKKRESINPDCFSQWYRCHFTINDVGYKSAEHYMMAEKARYFEDEETLHKILQAETPRQAKELGRLVKDFDQEHWEHIRFKIVIAGNMTKFSQNPELKSILLNTHGKILVEASPLDAIWGIGLAEDDPKALDPLSWKGLNLLGFALMIVRNKLAFDEFEKAK